MNSVEVLVDAFERIEPRVRHATHGLDSDALRFRPDSDANPIGWLVWHLTRVQDDHVSEIADRDQEWMSGWAERFGMAAEPSNVGYGHTSEDVVAFDPVSADLLLAYHREVNTNTLAWLRTARPTDLDRIIDVRWDPPVTVGVRLVSVIGDCMEHVGQAAYLRGILERAGRATAS